MHCIVSARVVVAVLALVASIGASHLPSPNGASPHEESSSKEPLVIGLLSSGSIPEDEMSLVQTLLKPRSGAKGPELKRSPGIWQPAPTGMNAVEILAAFTSQRWLQAVVLTICTMAVYICCAAHLARLGKGRGSDDWDSVDFDRVLRETVMTAKAKLPESQHVHEDNNGHALASAGRLDSNAVPTATVAVGEQTAEPAAAGMLEDQRIGTPTPSQSRLLREEPSKEEQCPVQMYHERPQVSRAGSDAACETALGKEAREVREFRREHEEARIDAEDSARAATKDKKTDDVVQALVHLKRHHGSADLPRIALCLRTLRTYIDNIARFPHDAKFQHIRCSNPAFRERVEAVAGAVAVLEACGFRRRRPPASGAAGDEGDAMGDVLAIDEAFLKTKGMRLWDALAKIDVVLGQVQSAL